GENRFSKSMDEKLLRNQRATRDIVSPDGEVLVKKNRKFAPQTIRRLQQAGLTRIPIELEDVVGKISAHEVFDESTGEVLLDCNEEITESKLIELREKGVESFKVL